MKVRKLMSRQPVTVTPTTSLDRAMELMDLHGIRHLPVMDGKELVGVISDRDLLEATGWLAPREREIVGSSARSVADLDPSLPVTIDLEADIEEALAIFVNARLGCLPVLEQGQLAGMLTEMDVLAGFLQAHRLGRVHPDRDLAVHEFMMSDPIAISPGASGDEAANLMAGYGIRHLLVMEGDELFGMLSDRDLRRLRGEGSVECSNVGQAMTPDPQVLSPHQTLSSAAALMSSMRLSALPVVDEHALGVVSIIDVLLPCASALTDAG